MIAQSFGIAYEAVVNRSIGYLLRLFAFAWLSLGIGVPASAWAVHASAHNAAQVGLDDHHHHNEDGSISVHDHDEGDAPDGGHNHMPSILLSAYAIPHAGMTLAMPLLERATFAMVSTRGVELTGTGCLRRPPRLG